MESKLCIQFLLIALAGCIGANAQFTCYQNEKQEVTKCNLINECYVIYNTKSGTRDYGCFIKMTDSQRKYCSRNPGMCKTCTGNNCNTKDLIKICISCQTKNDERCTTNPEDLPQNFSTACDGLCYTDVNENGHNTRGCLPKGKMCDDEYSCDECKDDFCNTEVFPKGRRVCNTKNSTEVCLKANDNCISILNSQGEAVKLGCTENLFKNENLKKMCEKNPKRCPQCNESECNGSATKHRCVVCDETDENCMDDPEEVETYEECLGKCYFHRDGDKVKRGCTDVYTCESLTCLECDEEYCNSEMCYTAW